MKIKKILAIVFVFALSFIGSKFAFDFLNQRTDPTYAGSGFEDNAVKKSDNEYLILMVGVDQAAGEENNEDFTRTDTIMLLKANTKDGTIKLLSVPRDSRVKIRTSFDKVNHAHAFGGIELTIQTLRNFLGLDIDYYVQINYKALVDIVDAIGGVDYQVPEGVEIDKWGIHVRPGMNHFDGTQTMWYLRTRHIYLTGDIGRVGAQQDFVKAMVDQAVKKSKQMNLMTIASTYIKYVKTNLPMSVIADLLSNIETFSSDKVETFTVPGHEETINATSYYIPDVEGTWAIRDKVFADFKLSKWKEEDSGFVTNDEEESSEESTPDTKTFIPNLAKPQPSNEAPVYNQAPSYNNNYNYNNNTYRQNNTYNNSNNNYNYQNSYEEEYEQTPSHNQSTEPVEEERLTPAKPEPNQSPAKEAPSGNESNIIEYEPMPSIDGEGQSEGE